MAIRKHDPEQNNNEDVNNNTGIVRKHREDHRRIINIVSLQDKRLSLKARGIMGYLLSKPKNWKGQVYDIVNNCPDGIRAVKSGLKELEILGYVELRSFPRKDTGQYQGKYYEVFNRPPRKKKAYITPSIEKVTDKETLSRIYSELYIDGIIKPVHANN